jgi:two-component sensor histidine kinase/multisubunit Na+/H+ antiporter MnhB subunit
MKTASFRAACRVVVIAFPSLLFGGLAWAGVSAPVAVDGLLDLRSWNFERDGPVSLAGEWDFFPGELLAGSAALAAPKRGVRKVPDQWNVGLSAGTYRLILLLPPSRPALGLRYSTVSTSFELEAEGLVIATAGRPAVDPLAAIPAYKPGVAPLDQGKDRVTLVARVSNHEYRVGGMWRAFTLGDFAALDRAQRTRSASSLCIAASLVVLALFALLFVRTPEAGGGFAAFTVFALAAALRALATGEYVIVECLPGLPFDIVIRLEYLSLFSLFLAGILFLRFLFPREFRKGISTLLLIACALFFPLLFSPLRVLTWSVLPYYAVACAVIATGTVVLIKAIAHGCPGGLILAVGGGALLVSALNDMLFSSFILNTANIFPFGLLVFVGAQAYALSNRYRAVQANLRAALDEKDMLIREVHHRVKNSLQIVASIVALQSHRSSDPAALAAYASIRDRIRAISLAHEELYSLDSGDNIDIADYARDLASQLASSFGSQSGGLELEAEHLRLPADLCIDIGLVLTELVANAFKHARGADGCVAVRARIAVEGDRLLLVVSDDGPGFPVGFDFASVATLGFVLVSTLAKKRRASLVVNKGRGAVIELRFPIEIKAEQEKNKEVAHGE